MFDARKNFVFSTVFTAPSPATSGTSLAVQVGDAALFPDPATEGEYNITVFPTGSQPSSSNAEIVRVTAKSSNTLTIVRQQENTSARTIVVGDNVVMATTAQMIGDLSQANWFKVTQTTHGFSVGNAIYHNGTNWQKAKADNINTIGTHIVTKVLNADNFFATQQGRVNIPSHGLTPGQFYFVSDATAGALTISEPTTYSNPIIYVEDANTVHVLPFRASSGAGYGSVPIGSVFPFAGTVVPLGYLLADGSAVSRTTYSDLFNLIGTTYGTGDGSTTFNVPNLKGKVPVGYNSSETEFDVLGETGGAKTHTLTTAQMPTHNHAFSGTGSNMYNETQNVGTGANSRNLVMLTATSYQSGTIGEAGSGGAHNNLQPYIALNYIIKANTPTESTSGLGTGGWNEINAVVTRQSADDPTYVLRFNSDVTGLFSAGMRIKITQTTDKFFIVTAVGSYSGGNTDITVYGGTDYDVADTATTAITKTYYSRDKAPKGFPLDPNKWSEKVTSTSNLSQSSPTSGTVYNLGSLSISGPVGVWDVYFQIAMQSGDDVTVSIEVFAGISTSASSFSDGEFKAYSYVAGSLNTIAPAFRRKTVTLTSKTTYYLVAQIIGTGVTNVQARGDASTTIICFTCAYL